ncbi:hypothetical protein RRG08_022041 [Elysia crispata]|uniref:Uncharacterized protein n=1 Tax=Elysia crispata TaxID=231223 RepID=A0AAE0YXV2_9GAST|nr:hypothetical protein RRG08_022041 [Elysia crispata]
MKRSTAKEHVTLKWGTLCRIRVEETTAFRYREYTVPLGFDRKSLQVKVGVRARAVVGADNQPRVSVLTV